MKRADGVCGLLDGDALDGSRRLRGRIVRAGGPCVAHRGYVDCQSEGGSMWRACCVAGVTGDAPLQQDTSRPASLPKAGSTTPSILRRVDVTKRSFDKVQSLGPHGDA